MSRARAGGGWADVASVTHWRGFDAAQSAARVASALPHKVVIATLTDAEIQTPATLANSFRGHTKGCSVTSAWAGYQQIAAVLPA